MRLVKCTSNLSDPVLNTDAVVPSAFGANARFRAAVETVLFTNTIVRPHHGDGCSHGTRTLTLNCTMMPKVLANGNVTCLYLWVLACGLPLLICTVL